MVTVDLIKDENGSLKGFSCSGHADFDEDGSDIVCSAVSMLVMNTINCLATLTFNHIECETDKESATITCVFPEGLDEKGMLLIDSMLYGLTSVEGKYGSEYVRIIGNENKQ